jgi:hypothetical protein
MKLEVCAHSPRAPGGVVGILQNRFAQYAGELLDRVLCDPRNSRGHSDGNTFDQAPDDRDALLFG